MTQFRHRTPYLVNVLLHGCGVGQKLVVQPGLLDRPLHVVAEPQAVDDGLRRQSGEGGVSAARGQALRGRAGAPTSAVAVVIWVPPEAPTTIRTRPSRSTIIAGHMDESGCFPEGRRGHTGWSAAHRGHQPHPPRGPPPPAPGMMKLAGEGGTPNWLVMLGELKSSISSLNRIPLTCESTLEPKLRGPRSQTAVPCPPGLAPPTHPPKLRLVPRDVWGKCSPKVEAQLPAMKGVDGAPPLGQGSPGPTQATWQLLLEVDGAGGRHGAAILRNHGQVGGAPVVWSVELRLVVGGWVSGVVGDPVPESGSEELGAHVSDHLPRPQSCPEEAEGWEGAPTCAGSSQEPPAMALSPSLLHPRPPVARLPPHQPPALLPSSNSECVCLSVPQASPLAMCTYSRSLRCVPGTGGSAGNRLAGPPLMAGKTGTCWEEQAR